jgi:hypothetical protein
MIVNQRWLAEGLNRRDLVWLKHHKEAGLLGALWKKGLGLEDAAKGGDGQAGRLQMSKQRHAQRAMADRQQLEWWCKESGGRVVPA